MVGTKCVDHALPRETELFCVEALPCYPPFRPPDMNNIIVEGQIQKILPTQEHTATVILNHVGSFLVNTWYVPDILLQGQGQNIVTWANIVLQVFAYHLPYVLWILPQSWVRISDHWLNKDFNKFLQRRETRPGKPRSTPAILVWYLAFAATRGRIRRSRHRRVDLDYYGHHRYTSSLWYWSQQDCAGWLQSGGGAEFDGWSQSPARTRRPCQFVWMDSTASTRRESQSIISNIRHRVNLFRSKWYIEGYIYPSCGVTEQTTKRYPIQWERRLSLSCVTHFTFRMHAWNIDFMTDWHTRQTKQNLETSQPGSWIFWADISAWTETIANN